MPKIKEKLLLRGLLFLLACYSIYAQDTTSSKKVGVKALNPRSHLFFSYEKSGLPYSASENVSSLHYCISKGLDHIIPVNIYKQKGWSGRNANMIWRALKCILLELPIDNFFIVANHEYFGHGARLREFGFNKATYHFFWPVPYGNGSAYTNFGGDISNLDYYQLLAVELGGFEAEAGMHNQLYFNWMTDGKIYYRDAFLNIMSEINMFFYVIVSSDNYMQQNSGYDFSLYLRDINNVPGKENPIAVTDAAEMKIAYALNAVNPMLIYSLLSLNDYFEHGNTEGKMYYINFGDYKYLPALGADITPFGMEYIIKNFLVTGQRVARLKLRMGYNDLHTFWGGADLSIRNLYQSKQASIDINTGFWVEPELKLRKDGSLSGNKTAGVILTLRGIYDLNIFGLHPSSFVEFGYKSAGYMRGYTFAETTLFMFGLGIRE